MLDEFAIHPLLREKVILSVNNVDLYINKTVKLCFISEREFDISDAS